MNGLRLGELCAGYGGLGMAVEEVFGATTAWFSEYDAAPSNILAHHWPGVPNHGDMTKIDWAAIEPVDIISGGTPCQDLSAAGRRKGMTEGTRSNLWVQMREAVAIQKPKYVVWENVRGAYSASAASDLEQCPGCVGDAADGRVFLRALGRVLGDLSDLGYDCQWRGLRAADVGACHGRFRVFVLAVDAGRVGGREGDLPAGISATLNDRATVPHQPDTRRVRPESAKAPEDADLAARGERWESAPGQAQGGRARTDTGGRNRTPTADAASPARRGPEQQHLSAPAGSAAEPGELAGAAPADAERLRGERWGVNGNLAGTPGKSEADGGERQRNGDAANHSDTTNWGEYGPAIRRWERILGRPAPRPTEPTGRNGGHRLSPLLTEWMMGLPEGWVTGESEQQWRDRIQIRRLYGSNLPVGMRESLARRGPLLSRNEQLKACGNGVVPQQAMAALRDMLAATEALEVAA